MHKLSVHRNAILKNEVWVVRVMLRTFCWRGGGGGLLCRLRFTEHINYVDKFTDDFESTDRKVSFFSDVNSVSGRQDYEQ